MAHFLQKRRQNGTYFRNHDRTTESDRNGPHGPYGLKKGEAKMISGISSSGNMDMSQMSNMRGQMKNPFDKMDTDGNGVLNKSEISSLAEKMSEKTGQSVNAGDLMARMDSDENGQVTQEEFKSGRPQGPPPGMMGMSGGGAESLLSLMNASEDDEESLNSIDELDANGDGIVDSEEASSGIESMIQQYLNNTGSTSGQNTAEGGVISLMG